MSLLLVELPKLGTPDVLGHSRWRGPSVERYRKAPPKFEVVYVRRRTFHDQASLSLSAPLILSPFI